MKIPRISSVVTGHDAYRDSSLVGREGELGVTVAKTRRRIDIRYSRGNELMKKIAGHVSVLHRPTTTNRREGNIRISRSGIPKSREY